MTNILLEGKNLTKSFASKKKNKRIHAVSDINLTIRRGECLALVGESGCGKSTLGRILVGLSSPDRGEVFFDGIDIFSADKKTRLALKRQMQIVFQDPYASLNPRMLVGKSIEEPIITHGLLPDRQERQRRLEELMEAVGLPPELLGRYPHQLSGGQRQRISIARAIALRPRLVICDEPVSALDVSVQSQILNLLKDLQEEYGLTYLFISHDLSVVNFLANRVCVMFLGKICELGDRERIFENPLHPYTELLLRSIPRPVPGSMDPEGVPLLGDMPSPLDPPEGCRFHTRCPYSMERCQKKEPLLIDYGGRKIACHRYG